MEKKKSNQKAKKQTEKNDSEALLNKVAQMLSKEFRNIPAIISNGNYIKIVKAKGKSDCPRLTYSKILPLLRKDYYLQIQEFKVINILFVAKADSAEVPKWVKLTTGECYNISKDFRTNFLHVLPQILKFIRIAEQREKRRHKKLSSSKFDL